MVDLAIAPIGLGGHLLEPAGAAERRFKAVASGLLDNERNLCVGIGKQDNIGS